jgi:hypothetical protein
MRGSVFGCCPLGNGTELRPPVVSNDASLRRGRFFSPPPPDRGIILRHHQSLDYVHAFGASIHPFIPCGANVGTYTLRAVFARGAEVKNKRTPESPVVIIASIYAGGRRRDGSTRMSIAGILLRCQLLR